MWTLGPSSIERILIPASFVLWLSLSGVYLNRCRTGRARYDLYCLLDGLLHSGTTAGGVLLMTSSVVSIFTMTQTSFELEKFVGGLLILMWGVDGIRRSLFHRARTSTPNGPSAELYANSRARGNKRGGGAP